MFLTILRVLFGFAMACLAAGLTKVLFAVGPRDLLSNNPDAILGVLLLAAQFATVFAVFAGLFALLAAVISEWQGLRGMVFHALVGLGIAVAGFCAQFLGEAPGGPSVFNNYGMGAYAVTGLVGGFVYWIFAGRLAGGYEEDIYDVIPPTGPTPAKPMAASAGPVPGPRMKTPAAPPPQTIQPAKPAMAQPGLGPSAKKE